MCAHRSAAVNQQCKFIKISCKYNFFSILEGSAKLDSSFAGTSVPVSSGFMFKAAAIDELPLPRLNNEACSVARTMIVCV